VHTPIQQVRSGLVCQDCSRQDLLGPGNEILALSHIAAEISVYDGASANIIVAVMRRLIARKIAPDSAAYWHDGMSGAS